MSMNQDLTSYVEKYVRTNKIKIPFKNRENAIAEMVDKFLMNTRLALDGVEPKDGDEPEILCYFDVVCVDFYGSGKTRLGREFVKKVGEQIKSADDFKSCCVSDFDNDFIEEELGHMSNAKFVRIEMKEEHQTNTPSFYKDLFQRGLEGKKKEIWDQGMRHNDSTHSVFLCLDEFEGEEKHLEDAIKDLRRFRRFLIKKMREFVSFGNRLYVYLCGRSNVLSEIGSSKGSPTKVCFIGLENLKSEHVKEIIESDDIRNLDIVPKELYEDNERKDNGLLDHFVGLVVEECGVVPRLLEIIFLILDFYRLSLAKLQLNSKEELERFVFDRILNVLVDGIQIPDKILRLFSSPEASFGVFSKEVTFLLHLCRFEVNVCGRMDHEPFDGVTCEKLISLSFFSLFKKTDKVHLVVLPNTFRRRLVEVTKRKHFQTGTVPLEDSVHVQHYFLLGSGDYLEYVTALSILRHSKIAGRKKSWNELFPSLGDGNNSVFGKSFVFATKVVDLPKITMRGKDVASFSSIEDVGTYPTLKPKSFEKVWSVLEKEKGIVLLIPREKSGSCDIYLYYCEEKMLVGIACKDYGDNRKFTKSTLDEEIGKFFPGGSKCGGVEHFVLLVCCTNVDYLGKKWFSSNFTAENDGISHAIFPVGEGKDEFELYCVLLDKTGLETFLTAEDLGRVNDYREKKKMSRAFDFVETLVRKRDGQIDEREKKMEDEESVTKMFNVFSYIENPNGGISEISFVETVTWEGLVKNLFEKIGRGNENEDYKIYDEEWKHLTEVNHIMKRPEMSTLYYVTSNEKQRKEEEEARKLKEEEEARKLKEEKEIEKLEKNGKVKIFLVKSADRKKLLFCDMSLDADLKKHEREETIEKLCEKKIIKIWRKNDVKGLVLFEYVSVKNSNNYVVGDEFDCEDEEDFEDFGNFLVGKICFLVTKEEKMEINELYGGTKKQGIDITKLKSFRASSGMSFLDKWFDDDDEEKGTGAISVDKMKDEESEWNKEILLECCDGVSLRKNMDELLQKSRFFRKMMGFNGKEAHEAREFGKIKLEFLSSLELEYYLNVIFDVGEVSEVGGTDNNKIRLLLRLLEFGMRYKERKLAEKVVNELETVIFPDLVSCGVLELRLMELGHLVHGRLPNGLFEELLDRLCSSHPLGQVSSKLMRYIEYSSQVMEKAQTFLEEGKDMLDEDFVQVDYGVGEVVSGNGDVLDQCFVGEFGGRLMVWNDASNSSFVGCLKDSTLERTLIKTKRRREQVVSAKRDCVEKVRKLMNSEEIERLNQGKYHRRLEQPTSVHSLLSN